MPIIGIDLGTTNSLVSVWKNGKSQLIPNSLGSYLTPSAVSLDENGEILVGQAARDRLVSHPDCSAASFKRLMGLGKRIHLGKREFTPEELSALVLRRLKEDAEFYLGEPVREAVVSVPAYFGEEQRSATKRAGALAGLIVERLVNEPSAAALAYRLSEQAEDASYLIFDLGGGTLDVSVVDCFQNVVSVIAVSGDNRLGGDDFDHAIAEQFCVENGVSLRDLPPARQASLIRMAEQCKQALTSQKAAILTAMGDGLSGSMTLTPQKLVELSARLFVRLEKPIRRALGDSALAASELTDTILVGGSCRMPVVKQYLAGLLGRAPLDLAAPETVVAMGVGAYAGMKERQAEIRDMVLTDICPFTLGTNVLNHGNPERDLMSPVIERNSVLPTSKIRQYRTASDNQSQMVFKICQGEEPYADDNNQLGVLSVPVPKGPKGKEAVDVRFTYDINGLLQVEVKSCTTGEQRSSVLLGKSGMDEKEVQARLTALQAFKIHPRDQEENRTILAQGERLFRETLGQRREQVTSALEFFQVTLDSQEQWKIERARRQIKAYLDRMDRDQDSLDYFEFHPTDFE